MKKSILCGAACLCLAWAQPAQASVIVDDAPSGKFQNGWLNMASGQNFLVQFSLPAKTTVTGMGIWTLNGVPSGATVSIRLTQDKGGAPDLTTLQSFSSVIANTTPFDANSELSAADIAPITLNPGTYWIGMAGSPSDISWVSYFGEGISSPFNQYQLQGNLLSFRPSIFDLVFQVYGQAVPEPAMWAMLLAGFGAIGFGARMRKIPIQRTDLSRKTA